jgi:FSR family fosmidomycin resistance protein-like MFS transporter
VNRPFAAVALTLLVIEFLDELVGGVREAAWPLIRHDLSLSYIQIGSLLGIPAIISSVIEPVLALLSDVWRRRVLILSGGAAFAVACVLTALSDSYLPLLLSLILFYPASGAFVGLSQAALMDHDPARRVQNMARWNLAGSLGVAAGPLALGAAEVLGLGWRLPFLVFAVIAAALQIPAWRSPLTMNARDRHRKPSSEGGISMREGLRGALSALRKGRVFRWLVLLKAADLMLDILFGLIALYYVDVVGVPAPEAATAVAVWTIAGLLGDFLVIPLLERMNGLSYLRASAAVMAVLFPAFLLAGSPVLKLILLASIGLAKSGWYSILKAELFASVPGKSGTALALDNIAGLAGSLVPIALGAVAQAAGLNAAMWLLLAGPVALLAGVPRVTRRSIARKNRE